MFKKLRESLIKWLTDEPHATDTPPCDFHRLKHEIRPGDVVLVEGLSHISKVIRSITQSPWTHAALYIGRLNDIEDDNLRQIAEEHLAKYQNSNPNNTEKFTNTRLIIEGLIGQGTIVTPLSSYRNHHIRICRPIGLSPQDSELVVAYAIKALGKPYNVKHLFDLARYLLPWSILPRRWGSSLFTTPGGEPESGICSSLLAEAFTSVKFPILPFITQDEDDKIEVFHRNPYLFTPKDFDYSPYFEIIKYPTLSPEEQRPYYQRLPWTERDAMHQGNGEFVSSKPQKKKTETPPPDSDKTTD